MSAHSPAEKQIPGLCNKELISPLLSAQASWLGNVIKPENKNAQSISFRGTSCPSRNICLCHKMASKKKKKEKNGSQSWMWTKTSEHEWQALCALLNRVHSSRDLTWISLNFGGLLLMVCLFLLVLTLLGMFGGWARAKSLCQQRAEGTLFEKERSVCFLITPSMLCLSQRQFHLGFGGDRHYFLIEPPAHFQRSLLFSKYILE